MSENWFFEQIYASVLQQTLSVISPPPVTFSINNLAASNSITCNSPTINLQIVSNYTFGAASYTWSSPSFTSNSSTVSVTAPTNFTITGNDPSTGCQMQQTLAIGINTTAPTNSVNPLTQSVICTSGNVTFTGTSSGANFNVQNNWYSPLNPLPGGVPVASSNNTMGILSGSFSPGVYTLQTTSLVNGCKAFKTVTVTSIDAWPTFGVTSTTNFSVGCVPLNQTTLSIINAMSTQTPPATCGFTFLPPAFGGTLAPFLGANTSTVTSLPGTWTLIVMDNSNNCKTILPVPITQNTLAPDLSASFSPNTQTLTCLNPTILATGSSTTANTTIDWMWPGMGIPVGTTSTLVLGPVNGPNTSSTSLVYANYTVVATNTVNACKTSSIVVINQNFKPPVSSPSIAAGSFSAATCLTNVPVVLTTGASTLTSGIPNDFIANPCWAGPSPQSTLCGPASYSALVPGVYSLTVMDALNGCKSTGTINVADKTQPPVITDPVATVSMDCGSNSAMFAITLTGSVTGGVRYLLTQYPLGAAFVPSNAATQNMNPLLSGTSSNSITVSEFGTYYYTVTNTLTGCQSYGSVKVVPNDSIGGITLTPALPSCTACCDGSVAISPPAGFTNYSMTASAGTLTGSPTNAITNLCYGKIYYCITNLTVHAYTTSPIYCHYCDSLAIENLTGIAKNSINDEIIIYPNPGSSVFYIKTPANKSGSIRIYNLEGKEIRSLILTDSASSSSDSNEYKIENMEAGIYFAELKLDGIVYRKKIVMLK